jgi:hypothetical protein
MAKLALARMVNIGTSRNFSKILVVLLAATAETRPPLVHQVYIYIYKKNCMILLQCIKICSIFNSQGCCENGLDAEPANRIDLVPIQIQLN